MVDAVEGNRQSALGNEFVIQKFAVRRRNRVVDANVVEFVHITRDVRKNKQSFVIATIWSGMFDMMFDILEWMEDKQDVNMVLPTPAKDVLILKATSQQISDLKNHIGAIRETMEKSEWERRKPSSRLLLRPSF